MLWRRLEAQREQREQPPERKTPAGSPGQQPPRPQGRNTARPAVRSKRLANADVVPAAAMGMQFPGLFERTRVASPTAEGAAPPTES